MVGDVQNMHTYISYKPTPQYRSKQYLKCCALPCALSRTTLFAWHLSYCYTMQVLQENFNHGPTFIIRSIRCYTINRPSKRDVCNVKRIENIHRFPPNSNISLLGVLEDFTDSDFLCRSYLQRELCRTSKCVHSCIWNQFQPSHL